MNFIDDPQKCKKMSIWLIRIVVICLVIYLALRYLNMVGTAVSFLANLLEPLIIGCILALVLNVPMRPIEKKLFPGYLPTGTAASAPAAGDSHLHSGGDRPVYLRSVSDRSGTDPIIVCNRRGSGTDWQTAWRSGGMKRLCLIRCWDRFWKLSVSTFPRFSIKSRSW